MEPLARISLWLEELRAHRRVALDTNLVIYYLEDVSPYNELTFHLMRLMERGVIAGVLSTVVQAEVLVKPLRERNQRLIDRMESFFRQSPNLALRSVDSAVARRAALVRSATQLPLPDAIIVATALEERCDVIIGNDGSIARHNTGVPYVYLQNYV